MNGVNGAGITAATSPDGGDACGCRPAPAALETLTEFKPGEILSYSPKGPAGPFARSGGR